MKVYGPYINRENRRFVVIIRDDGSRVTKQYARFLMEQKLGRELDPDLETIDHIDGNIINDDLSNLQILPRKEHVKLDAKRVKSVIITCKWCGEKAEKLARVLNYNARLGKAGPFCGKSCASKYARQIQLGNIRPFEVQKEIPIKERTYYTNKAP